MITDTVAIRCDARDNHCGVMMLQIRDGAIELRGRHHGEKHVMRVPLRDFWRALREEHPEWLV